MYATRTERVKEDETKKQSSTKRCVDLETIKVISGYVNKRQQSLITLLTICCGTMQTVTLKKKVLTTTTNTNTTD